MEILSVGSPLMKFVSRRAFVLTIIFLGLGFASAVDAQQPAPAGAPTTLFQNVRIFDGKSGTLSLSSNVLVKGNIIARISTAPIAAESGTAVIDGGGRTLMPGLIDAHWHAMLASVTPVQAFGDVGYNNLIAAGEATAT